MVNNTVKHYSPDNDPRWKPGQSGNPNGRPSRSSCVSTLLGELLKGDPQKLSAQWKASPTGAMIVAMALFAKMGKGDLTAIKEGLDRVEGKVPQPIGGQNGEAIPVRITYEPTNSRKEAPE